MPSKALDESRTLLVLADVLDERRRQHALRGTQSLPWGVRGADALALRKALALCRRRQDEGADAWPWVIVEEALEAALEPSEEKRRAELVQLAAVAVQAAEGARWYDRPAGEAFEAARREARKPLTLDPANAPPPEPAPAMTLSQFAQRLADPATRGECEQWLRGLLYGDEARCCSGGPRGPSCGACEISPVGCGSEAP